MKKWSIILLLVILFIISVVTGFMIRSFMNYSKNDKSAHNMIVLAQNDMRKNIKNVKDGIKDGTFKIDKNGVIKTSSSEIIVSPNAQVIMTQKYNKCGHTRTTKQTVPREIVNLGIDGIQDFYNEWSIDDFSQNEIKISRNNLGICDEHYILGESDGYISVSCKNDIGEYIFKGLTDISVQYLPEQDLEKLRNGIEVIGKDNLNKTLEDYE